MLINYSFVPHVKWRDDKRRAAEKYGYVLDYKLPIIMNCAESDDIRRVCEDTANRIFRTVCTSGEKENAVLVDGDPMKLYWLTNRLLAMGITVISEVCERTAMPDGSYRKTFIRFREY